MKWTNLNAVIVGLLLVVSAGSKLGHTVVKRTVAHEAVLQGVVSLLVPFVVANHLFPFDDNLHGKQLGKP